MHNVDFPRTALMSVTTSLRDGTTCEVATVGSEAFVEIDAALEGTIAFRSASCQFSGDVARLRLGIQSRSGSQAGCWLLPSIWSDDIFRSRTS